MLGVSLVSGVARWFPEAMLRICPGYRSADDGEPVARFVISLCYHFFSAALRGMNLLSAP